ncbi:VOC family protein [Parasalinivibrio latis]|uniref:VOC family protein n=1 Tax=Parasalinivibrio latis TaxID=2952610 RepID=UPI0030DEB479
MEVKNNPVGWFEISVDDMDRAVGFYEFLLGYKLELHDMEGSQMAWFPQPVEANAYGATGTLIKAEGCRPSMDGNNIYFSVDNIEACCDRASEAGGSVILPKTSIGEHGFFALIRDTEGNRVGIHCMS